MSESETVPNCVVRGRQYVTYADQTQWSRRIDERGNAIGPWQKIERTPTEPLQPLKLHVVAESQADGEPKHWSLFAGRSDENGRARGQVWQVTGDAEYMHYEHASDVYHFETTSFAWHQTVNTDLSDVNFAEVDRLARSEIPPRAASRKEVTENCQSWVIRVLRRLVAEGFVEARVIPPLQQCMDPIN